ncbi:MAG: M15 family metallopeptidase [Acidimicrobiales bacterium]
MAEIRRVLAVLVATGMLAAAPAAAQDAPSLVEPDTYLVMFDQADLRGMVRPDDVVYDALVEITGDPEVDQRIRVAAEARGYTRRPVAAADLVPVDGRRLQDAAAEAWTAMKAAARDDGVALVMTSAYRDLDDQRALFLRRLDGRTSDTGIDEALRTSAPPGYSKHHGGYAIDVGQAGGSEVGFAGTAAYRWLSDFDFARAKRFGFIPSYPVDGEDMGPDPEAWEFVWVGPGRISCATGLASVAGFCDIGLEPRRDDIVWTADLGVTVGCAPGRFCPDDPITRGEAASMLWRLHGAPPAATSAPFADVFALDHFRPAVDWLWSIGVVAGTSPATFSPEDFLAPDEAFALIVRLAAVDDRPAPSGLAGPAVETAADPLGLGDPGALISRAEFASVLRASAAA